MRLYLDANAIIYSIEGLPRLRDAALFWILKATSATEGEVLTSRLSTLECRVKPIRDNNSDTLALYDSFFTRTVLAEITAEIIDRATDLRARPGLSFEVLA